MAKPTLRRALSLPLLTLYGLGVTVGAGIYVLIGATAAKAGIYAPVSFLVAAAVVVFTALSYAEFSTRYPLSAGEAAYVDAGFARKHLSLLIGILVMMSGVVSTAVVSIGAAEYASRFLTAPSFVLLICVVAAISGLAIWGIFESVLLAGFITLVEISGLLLVLFVGWTNISMDPGRLPDLIPPFDSSVWAGIASGALLAFFAFIGFEDMANVAEEVKNPRKTLPRAILLTLILSTILYLAVVMVVVANVPLDQLITSAAPLSYLFSGETAFLYAPFGIIAILATLNGGLIQIIMASRVLYGLAAQGHLPSVLSSVNAVTRTPVLATIIVGSVSLGLALWFPIEELAAFTSLMVLVVFFTVNLSLIRVKLTRQTRQAQQDIFVIPLWVPILGAVAAVGLAVTRLI
ncbi:amino acid permease [Sneathiella marina]|uniref:Amino acid permease n=1 Tax=Sneathiella marina TaxID=2950108 RepID=A0ABY4W3N1_9PROT|nr:amino acid permease [Sneathiella marina]USG61426.1 amino acid permease [Sneathiella marina]